jgi:hypothetical protein
VTNTDLGKITYCANACTMRRRDEKIPKRTTPPSRLCRSCEDRLREWLREIPTNAALVPLVIEHGTVDADPGSKATKRAWAPAPLRLEVLDLLDSRLGRKWQGTAVRDDARMGPLGDLINEADVVTDRAGVTPSLPPIEMTMTQVCDFLARHLTWITRQDEESVKAFYKTIGKVHRAFADAVGDFRRPPVAHCHIARSDGTACGGPIYASDYGGVRCARCTTTWDPGQLRLLGMAQEDKENA